MRASFADFSAEAADLVVQNRALNQIVGCCSTDFRTAQHETKVLRLGMFAPHSQAMFHRLAQAYSRAATASLDARIEMICRRQVGGDDFGHCTLLLAKVQALFP